MGLHALTINPLRHPLQCLRDPNTDGTLLALLDQQRQLLQAIRTSLAPPLAAHCLYATLKEGQLTLITDSAAWATRLRYQIPELTASLGSLQGEIATCRVRVQPRTVRRRTPEMERERGLVSPATVSLLKEAADAQGDTELGRALSRLAQASAGIFNPAWPE